MSESIVAHDVAALRNLGVLSRKAVALDASALLRVRPRTTDGFGDSGVARVWATTPFGPLACRTMAVSPSRADMVVRADAVVTATGDGIAVPATDSAVPMTLDCGGGADASWPGSLPLDDGWSLVGIVPATALRGLEKSARSVASEESGPMGLPTSLLDQKVIRVSAANGEESAADGAADGGEYLEITMREVFALCAMGFIPAEPTEHEPVRVSRRGRWRRMDGRFGSVYASDGLGVLPI